MVIEHIMPVDDLIKHEPSLLCQCNPELLENEPQIYIHPPFDDAETIRKWKRQTKVI